MKYSNEIIKQALKSMAKSIPITQISADLKISKSTLYQWKKKYQTELENIKKGIEASKDIAQLRKKIC